MDKTNSKVLQVTVLARVNTKEDNDASILGGNLVRVIEASIPQEYEIVGVEYAGATDDAPTPVGESTRRFNKPREAKDKDGNVTAT